jgi:hypothetical protein
VKNTHLIPLILYACLMASVGTLGAGYLLAGYWWMIPLFFLLALFWGFTIKHPVLWISSSLLSTHVILAAIGIAAGFSQFFMIASCICALASWDLTMFDQRMDGNAARNTNASLGKRHLQSLVWATAIGLILVLFGYHLNLQLPFGVIVLLVLIALGCLIYGFSFILRKST